MNSEELYFYFIQKNRGANGQGIPNEWRPQFGEAYENFVEGLAMPPAELRSLSDEVFLVLQHMIQFETFRVAVDQYLLSEARLRKMEQSKFNFDLELLRAKLDAAKHAGSPANEPFTNHVGQTFSWP